MQWWAQRLGSVFRGLLLGSVLRPDADFRKSFYLQHSFAAVTVFDPFMGSLIGQLLASIPEGEPIDAINALVDRTLDVESFSPEPAVRPRRGFRSFEIGKALRFQAARCRLIVPAPAWA